jgi:hypothetical protein
MQLLRGSSIGQISSGKYIKVEYDSGSALNSAPPPTGGQTGPSQDLLLNTYSGTAAAYSVRLLDKDYTGYCMKVRRASDDAEADIGFDSNGDLDTAAIATHCGASNGFVSVWYDQANVGGTAKNATQSTAGNQPQIYNGTAVLTLNGKPVLSPPNTGRMQIGTSINLSSANSFFYVGYADRDGRDVMGMDTTPLYRMFNGSTSACTFGFSPAPTYFHNGVEQTTIPTRDEAYDFMSVGQRLLSADFGDRAGTTLYIGGSSTYMIQAQELIVYLTDQSSNRAGIESDIDTYFSIP